MQTGYWAIDAFIIANIILWITVAGVFIYQQYSDGGSLVNQSNSTHSRSRK
ncbi:hypothetical protein [Photobacterium toruni]|uniref:Uncharacterized protein n=1 Tax=Photobacterium toruni TaxID=1935446 RepID=A0A1T4UTQ3_9GAMM|nr:hypothetical protein [Photobacterium toruni]MEC6814495.1 hypothetical protein [Photobacterium toruni]MEC6830722.1 hypothetical protein [Photobacterium toruni]SKA55985.1 hypothetical protein CZ814_03688 [Photobacterium toruni]